MGKSRLMATIHYKDTNMGIATGLSAWVDADESHDVAMLFPLQFGDYKDPLFTKEEMKALDGKKVMVVNPDTRETLYTLKELHDITKTKLWKRANQVDVFRRNCSLFVLYPGGRACEKSTSLIKEKMPEEQKPEKISLKAITVLIQELETVLKEAKDILENAPRKFQFLEYKKAFLIEPLQQALRQITYFTHIQESAKDIEFALEKRFDTVKFESRIELGAPILYITGDKPRVEEDVITDDLTEGQEVWLPTLAGYTKGVIEIDAYGEPYAEKKGCLFSISCNERNEWISTGMANLKGISKLKLGPHAGEDTRRLMATLNYNPTDMGITPGLSAAVHPDDTYDALQVFTLQFRECEGLPFTEEQMKALHNKHVAVVNPDTGRYIKTAQELRELTDGRPVCSQAEAFRRNLALFDIEIPSRDPGGQK